jgi:hypothetical protein
VRGLRRHLPVAFLDRRPVTAGPLPPVAASAEVGSVGLEAEATATGERGRVGREGPVANDPDSRERGVSHGPDGTAGEPPSALV